MSESPSPPPPILREARAAVFAALCVLVAALGHGAFSVGGIPLWALAAATAALHLGARLLTRRERGLTAILAVMAGVQVGLHFFFELAQRGAAMPMRATAASLGTTNPAAVAGMANMPDMPARGRMWCGPKEPDLTATLLHIGAIRPGGPANLANPPDPTAAAHAATTAAATVTTTATTSPMAGGMTAGMLAVHVLAALAAAWWLRRGEAAAWSTANSVALFLFAPLLLLFTTVFAPATPTTAVVRTPAPRLGPGRLLRHFVTRRGPPVAFAAFC